MASWSRHAILTEEEIAGGQNGISADSNETIANSAAMRRLVRETTFSVDNLIYPLFVCEGNGIKKPIDSMADCFHFSPDMLAAEIEEISKLKIPAVLLFGLPDKKG